MELEAFGGNVGSLGLDDAFDERGHFYWLHMEFHFAVIKLGGV